MHYIKHLFYIWKPWKWKLIDSCRNALICGRPMILSRPAITHFALNSFLWWKHKKWFQEGKSLKGNLASFHGNWIALLFPDLQYEIVSWNWVSAVLAQLWPCSEAGKAPCPAVALPLQCTWRSCRVSGEWRAGAQKGRGTARVRTVREITKARRTVLRAASPHDPVQIRIQL